MRLPLLFVGLLLPQLAHAVPSLSAVGSCPGPATIEVSGITPFGTAAFIHGGAPGSDVFPGGPCAGRASGLRGLTYLTSVRDADGDGVVRMSPTLPGGACSRWLQALDTGTCATSGVLAVGDIGGGGAGGIVPGDTDNIVTFVGGEVWDETRGVWNEFGAMDFRCTEWDGRVCVNLQSRNALDTCASYPNSGQWHRNLFVNDSQNRNCRLICQATTGSESWNVCEGGAANADPYWAYSWSQPGTECSGSKYLWRTDGITAQCDPFCLNIALGTNYAGSPNLRVECTAW